MRNALLVAAFTCALATAGCASPTPTPEPTSTPEPTATATPELTATVAPTETALPTATATTEPTVEPTAAPAAGDAGQPTTSTARAQDGAKPLKVEFKDLHYECQKQCFRSRVMRPDETLWAYRSFQALMVVDNVSTDLTLAGGQRPDEGWAPRRWYVTDGATEWTEDYAWQWSYDEFFARPDIAPSGRAEWTWITMPVPYGAWVKAVEYEDPWGNLYCQEFAKPEIGQMNYEDCGDPREGEC